ncbi:hypothetical protein P7K49_011998 [Saguinus oedipus]|uniref:Uncharacterized protein n=1 Tax=Saguinus oedipus TaxID=9490 RepID=A0ABQ9VSY8_SAGOE|nr:hypothetical protein P7K49_011998 [Saguinus oedipus]
MEIHTGSLDTLGCDCGWAGEREAPGGSRQATEGAGPPQPRPEPGAWWQFFLLACTQVALTISLSSGHAKQNRDPGRNGCRGHGPLQGMTAGHQEGMEGIGCLGTVPW